MNTPQKNNYNPLPLGLLYFGFALSLWTIEKPSVATVVIASLSTLVSLAFFIAIFWERFLVFLYTKVVKKLIPTTFVISLFGFVFGWLQTFSQIQGLILQVIVYFGFAWVAAMLLVEVNEIKQSLRKSVGIFTAAAFMVLAVIRFFEHNLVGYIAGGELIALAILILSVAMGWLPVHGKVLE